MTMRHPGLSWRYFLRRALRKSPVLLYKQAKLRLKSVLDSCSVVEIKSEQRPFFGKEPSRRICCSHTHPILQAPLLYGDSRELSIFVALKLKLVRAAHIGSALFIGI